MSQGTAQSRLSSVFRTNCLEEQPKDSTQPIYGFPGLTSFRGRHLRTIWDDILLDVNSVGMRCGPPPVFEVREENTGVCLDAKVLGNVIAKVLLCVFDFYHRGGEQKLVIRKPIDGLRTVLGLFLEAIGAKHRT